MWPSIWVFTICKSMSLPVNSKREGVRETLIEKLIYCLVIREETLKFSQIPFLQNWLLKDEIV